MYEKTEEPFFSIALPRGQMVHFNSVQEQELDIGRPNREDKVELPLILASGVLV